MRLLKTCISCIVALSIAVLAVPQDAADLPVVNAVRTTQPITIDGNLDEPAWTTDDQWYGQFSLLGRPDLKASVQTRFKVAFDDENIYLAAVLDEPHMDKLKENATSRDSHVHHDDCLEFMLDPQGERTEYFHFTVNSLGTLYDAELRQGGHVRSVEWDCPWEAEISKQDSSWTVEACVPVVYLGLTGASTGDWALSVTRERQADKRELSSFTDALGGFHQPAKYAVLKLPGADFARFLWHVEPPFEATVLPRDGKLVYEAKTHITNQTGRFWFLSIAPGLQKGVKHETGARVHAGLDAGQGRQVAFSAPLPDTGKQTLQIRLLDRRNPRRVLAVKTLPLQLTYSPITIDVTQPCYRQTIYATQKLSAIEADIHLAMTSAEMAGAQVSAALMKGDEEIAASTPVKAATTCDISVPIPTLADGKYALAVSVTKAGKVLHQADTDIAKVPPPPGGHEWRLNENNVLLHNGEPYFIYGWFSGSAADLADPDLPHTATQSYGAHWYDSEKVRRDMFDPIAESGGFITTYPYPTPRMMDPDDWQRPLNDEEKETLRQRIAELKDHPALWAWYLADEPELRPALPQRMREIYQIIRDEDPYHPQLLLNDTIAGISKYAGASDIFIPDPYPLFMEGGDAGAPINKTSQFMQACYEAGGGRKGIMITPQAFNYGDCGLLGNRAPNFTEVRNQGYQAIVNRATGILWYTNRWKYNYPELDVAVTFVGHEMIELKEAIFATPAEGLDISAEQPEEVQASLRKVADRLYLFVVNTATDAQTITIKLPGDLPGKLWVVSENRAVQVADNAITDAFDKYATHIYTSVEALAKRPQLAAGMDDARAAEAALKKPGNLAFRDSGVVVEASSSRHGYETKTVDGALGGLAWSDKTYRKLPDWLTLTWPEPQTIRRVIIYTSTIADLKLQVPDENAEGGWRTIAETAALEDPSVELTFAPVSTTTLRIFITRLRGDSIASIVQEVEAYAK